MNILDVWNNGYGTGYVQARADICEITQDEADREIEKINESFEYDPNNPLPKEPEWKYQIREVVAHSEIRREKEMRELLHFAVDEMYKEHLSRGGDISIQRTRNSTAIVCARPSEAAKREIHEAILTESESQEAIEGYKAGLAFQDIATILLAQRNEGLIREMTREIGRVCSKAVKRQMYPVEFYGLIDIKGDK
jgi:hypothetical protein